MSPRLASAAVWLLRVCSTLLLTLGIGALAAAIASIAASAATPWTRELSAFGFRVALAGLAGAVAALTLLPAPRDLVDADRREAQVRVPRLALLLLMVLAAAALAQIPPLLVWLDVDRALLGQLGLQGDRLGLELIPTVLLYSLPALTAALLACFLLTSAATAAAPATSARRVLAGGIALQVGLLAVLYFTVDGAQEIDLLIQRTASEGGAPDVSRDVADWFTRHDSAARAALRLMPFISAGYLLPLAIIHADRRRAF